MRGLLRSCVLLGLVAVMGGAARGEEKKPARILFITQSAGFVHDSVKRKGGELAPAEVAMIQLGKQSGVFSVDCSQDTKADFTKENLQRYDIVAFYTTLDLPIAEGDREYFINDWLKQKGHGFMGFHSAGDTFHEYEPYWEMAGGTFISHPWTQDKTVTLTVHDPEHPGAKPFGKEYKIQDEIYMYRHWQPGKVRVLMSLDYAKSPTEHAVPTEHGYHVPVAWVKEWGEGKVYYNNLGHRPETWANKDFHEAIIGAVHWIRGDAEGSAKPNPEVSKAMEEKSQKDFEQFGFKKAEQKKK